MKPTHTIKKKKKTGLETLPLAIPQVELHSDFLRKTKSRQIFTVLCTTVDFELILARFCDVLWLTIRNLLDFSMEVSIFFSPDCILFPWPW